MSCEDPDGVHDFAEIEILDDDEDSTLRAGMKVIIPCSTCGKEPLEQFEEVAERILELEAGLARVLQGGDTPLYHWSPAARRKQIERYGLRPRMRPSTNSVDAELAGWFAPYICFGTTPSWAWALSGAQRGSPAGEWDLWQTWSGRLENLEVLAGYEGDGVHEVRVGDRVYKRHLWLVGSRMK